MGQFTSLLPQNGKQGMLLLLVCLGLWQSAWAVVHTNPKHPSTSSHTTHHTHQKVHHQHKHNKKHHATHYANVSLPTPVNHPALMSVSGPSAETGLMASFEKRIIHFVQNTVETLHYSSYKLGGTKVDQQKGVYVLDCSSYVDYILKTMYPHAYFNLVNSTGSDKPTTQHYYDFLTELSDEPKHYWDKIDEVEQLRPGDILVFRNKHDLRSGNHVMVVMNKPIRDTDSFLVRVADSAPVGHSHDTRPYHVSGIGIGTLLLRVNSAGQPLAYAWRVGSQWKRNVNFAMGRPIDM